MQEEMIEGCSQERVQIFIRRSGSIYMVGLRTARIVQTFAVQKCLQHQWTRHGKASPTMRLSLIAPQKAQCHCKQCNLSCLWPEKQNFLFCCCAKQNFEKNCKTLTSDFLAWCKPPDQFITMSLADWFSLTAPAMDAPAYFCITHSTFTIHSQQSSLLKQPLVLTSWRLLFGFPNWKIKSIFDGFAAYFCTAKQWDILNTWSNVG